MPKHYGGEFRRSICERLVAGEAVTAVSEQSGVSVATLHLRKRQALIDAGLRPGTKSVEVDELARAGASSKSSRPSSRRSRRPAPCSTGTSRSGHKAVPGRPRPEESGLHRTRDVSHRRRLAFVLLRAQVPAVEPRDPSALGQRSGRRHPPEVEGHLMGCCASELPVH